MTNVVPYTQATYAAFERTLVARLPLLAEPAQSDPLFDPARAARLLGVLVETLAGVAVGLAVGRVATAVGRGLPGVPRDAVIRQVARSAARDGRLRPLPRLAPDLERRSPVDELGVRMKSRLGREIAGSCALVSEIRDTIARASAELTGDFDALLERLATDELAAFRFGEHLDVGWYAYRAALSGAALGEPAIGSNHTHATWTMWRAYATGATMTEPAGYILRVG